MKKSSVLILTVVFALVLIIFASAFSIFMFYFSMSNKEISLRNAVEAQQNENMTVFDKMTKTILQQAQINEKYAEDFKEIFIKGMEARYSGKDPAMLWITEQNNNLSPETYLKLMNSVEALRAEFQQRQAKLISIAQEHKNLITMFPGSLILQGRQPIKVQLVTSTKTQKAFDSGIDDDTQLYQNKNPAEQK